MTLEGGAWVEPDPEADEATLAELEAFLAERLEEGSAGPELAAPLRPSARLSPE